MNLVLTGILLMFYYVPSTEQAYDRMLDLRGAVAFGTFLRNVHRWAAHGMVAVVFLHMCHVFLTGSYKKLREFKWVLGVALLILTLGLSFTGYLLPWDQLAFWAITVGAAIAGYAPVFGKDIQFLLLGDANVGQEALLRFYVLHVAVLPAILTLLMAIHFWRIRKDGGLSRPEEAEVKPVLEMGGAEMAVTVKALPARTQTHLRPARPGARPAYQGRQRAGPVGVLVAEPGDCGVVRSRDHAGRDPGAVAAVRRAA